MCRILLVAVGLLLSNSACVNVDVTEFESRRTVVYRRPKPPPPVRRPPPRPYTRRHDPRPKVTPPTHTTARTSWMPRSERLSSRWTTIVLHHSATPSGNARLFDKFHRGKGWDELGYHFVIGNGSNTPDGYIEVGPRWHKQKHGAHCKTPDNYFNEHGIGICLVGDFTKSSPRPRQLASLDQLLRFLTRRCGIAPGNITTHAAVTGKTQCPGPHFHLAGVHRALAQQVTASAMP